MWRFPKQHKQAGAPLRSSEGQTDLQAVPPAGCSHWVRRRAWWATPVDGAMDKKYPAQELVS